MYEIKMKVRTQAQTLEELKSISAALEAGNAELREKIAKTEADRKADREDALRTEMSLRRHCEQTQESYTQIVK